MSFRIHRVLAAAPALALLGLAALATGCDGETATHDTTSSALTEQVEITPEELAESFHVTVTLTNAAIPSYPADAMPGDDRPNVLEPVFQHVELPLPAYDTSDPVPGAWWYVEPVRPAPAFGPVNPTLPTPQDPFGGPIEAHDGIEDTRLDDVALYSATNDLAAHVLFSVPEPDYTDQRAPGPNQLDLQLIADDPDDQAAIESGSSASMIDVAAACAGNPAPCTIGLTVVVSHTGDELAQPRTVDVAVVKELIGATEVAGLTVIVD